MGWWSKLEEGFEELQWRIKDIFTGIIFLISLIAIPASFPAIVYVAWRTAVFVFTKAKSLIFTGATEFTFFPKRSFEEMGLLKYGSLREWLHFTVDWTNTVIGWINSSIAWFNNLSGFWQGCALNGLWVYPLVIAGLIMMFFEKE